MSKIIYSKGRIKTEITIEALQNEMAQYLQMDNLSFLLGAGCSSNIVKLKETGISGMAVMYTEFFKENQGNTCPQQDRPYKGQGKAFRGHHGVFLSLRF